MERTPKQQATYEAGKRHREKHPEKAKAAAQRYYEKNKEKIRAVAKEKMRQKRAANPGYAAEIGRRYRERNPERFKAFVKKNYYKHKEHIKAKNIEWHKAHPTYNAEQYAKRLALDPKMHAKQYAKDKDKMRAAAQQWRLDNPERARDISKKNTHRRRIDKNKSAEHYTLAEIRELRATTKYCRYCGFEGRLSIDHVVPLRHGGSNAISNIELICLPCNVAKQDTDAETFARKRGAL